MSKTASKFYICMHENCPFETAKRKAIYTHLVRTHSERKEDYECEYCSTIFEDEAMVEDHLITCHPDKQFTYTCVSRIENVINKCAKLGFDRACVESGHDANGSDVIENDDVINAQRNNSGAVNRTKASVNDSLNNLAAKGQNAYPNQYSTPLVLNTDIVEDDDTAHFISSPGSLKMTLNLKKIAQSSPNDCTKERSKSPPKLEPTSPPSDFDYDISTASPPNIIPFKGTDCVSIREKSSKYFDRLEVYHTTDEHGRRCCPFCPYKTTKNTIRVHLSGIHKIYFVKCSLCEYKAAFPHQVTQHGVKFHKTTHLNVIQLSKESRERTIFRLNGSKDNDKVTEPNQSYNYSLNSYSAENSLDGMVEEEDFSDQSSVISGEDEPEMRVTNDVPPRDERVFKPPKSQMSKTDYFSIKVENGVHQYSCNLCPFKTPVRATIYTHKYRHEDKNYKCAYCDFISAPRSNVVHHLRSKHKNRAIIVSVVNDDGVAMETDSDNQTDTVNGLATNHIKQELPSSSCYDVVPESQSVHNGNNKDQPTIIKVPQYKRTLTSVSGGSGAEHENPAKRQKTIDDDYKLSLNKLYKVNPRVSPKYICVECSYGCDTHPKMKHHLYRHRPQQYKCPYCDHRKYPRSYVVRHVRDTHRDKPVRVIDLSIGPEPIDIPEYMEENDDDSGVLNDQFDEMATDESEINNMDDMSHLDNSAITDDTKNEDSLHRPNTDRCVEVKVEPENAYPDELTAQDGEDRLSDSLNSTTSIINNLNQTPPISTPFDDDTNDVNPNFSEVVYTSTPLIESLINGKFPGNSVDKPVQRTSLFRKKSLKDYRINYGDGPKYICNICDYGTENYKTIHNHMYRHESQKFQCPYCGYRRSPKSFVENHIREVHRGHPLFVTELKEELEDRVPLGSPRQCVMNMKKKEQLSTHLEQQTHDLNNLSKDDLNLPNPSKLQIKWPAPKPASQIGLAVPNVQNVTPPLQIPVRQKSPNAVMVPISAAHSSIPGNHANKRGSGATATSVLPPNVSPFRSVGAANALPRYTAPLANGTQKAKSGMSLQPPILNQNAVKFKEPSRTTYKTMYKCVFDPESCNHISKDKSKMKQHLFMHVEYKPWSCDLCEMTASQSSHIKNHVRMEHYGVSDMSFKYKKHNYLEKHIDTFLTKGLFTVPVTEYRMIMNMKGNTKASYRTTFDRDSDGFVLCPHCDYKTKSGSITDHVKMKHMQPRFKCQWCPFKAFYRSEIRRHHRSEKSHAKLEFKIQELDLKEAAEEYTEGKPKETCLDTTVLLTPSDEPDRLIDIEGDDDDDEDASSNEDLSEFISYSTGKVNTNLTQNGNTDIPERTTCLKGSNDKKSKTSEIIDKEEHLVERRERTDGAVDTKPIRTSDLKLDKTDRRIAGAKFKCGYCSFSADLRMKVKMHCGKKHTGQSMLVMEPAERKSIDAHTTSKDNIMRVSCSELKGTRFEADLKKAGVSKLNLASLFPSQNDSSHLVEDGDEVFDDGSDDEDNFLAHNDTDLQDIDVPLTIPFKKACESSKINIPLSKIVSDKHLNSDLDSTFKIPLSPALTSKMLDKKRETIHSQKQTKHSMDNIDTCKSIKPTSSENEKDVSAPPEMVVLIEKDTYTGNTQEISANDIVESATISSDKAYVMSENQQTSNITDLAASDLNCNVSKTPLNDINPDETTHTILKEISIDGSKKDQVKTVDNQENNTPNENTDCCLAVENTTSLTEDDKVNNESSDDPEDNQDRISIPALDVDIDVCHFKPDDIGSNMETGISSEVNINNDITSNDGNCKHEKDDDEDATNADCKADLDSEGSSRILMNLIVHKTFPRGSPVVLEMENDEEGQDNYDSNVDVDEDKTSDIDDRHSDKDSDKISDTFMNEDTYRETDANIEVGMDVDEFSGNMQAVGT